VLNDGGEYEIFRNVNLRDVWVVDDDDKVCTAAGSWRCSAGAAVETGNLNGGPDTLCNLFVIHTYVKSATGDSLCKIALCSRARTARGDPCKKNTYLHISKINSTLTQHRRETVFIQVYILLETNNIQYNNIQL
jgi:hypothetical protein